MHQVLLIGAGKSATVLIDYLSEQAALGYWNVVVADRDIQALQTKLGNHSAMRATALDITDEAVRLALVAQSDLVISMLPPHLHLLVAKDCCRLRKHLLTASYTDEAVWAMEKDILDSGVLFLYEMGLDPGIDHMSAMRLIDQIHRSGGYIRRFLSHCGGLVAPESDRNPWHYLFTWNPRNVVQAGKAGARYRQQGQWVNRSYEEVFDAPVPVQINGLPVLEAYPNRDVQHYLTLYGLADAR
ncbi:MAG TPA: saccharopine dehydrogenase C-terminal domain-containing protein, partial [Sediminibacterium sp.]|nr:saccharopine dehydrogenase C-terminal domain-containing protein [Sediminibacterium sp.]